VRQDADRVRGYPVASESSPIGVWTGNAKHDHSIGRRTVDTNLAGELSSVELCLRHPCGSAHPPKASGFDLVVVDFPTEFARYLCGFLACTHLSMEDLHEVKCNRILREVDIQLRKADSQKTGTASLLCLIVASTMTCGSYHPEITLHRHLDDVATELSR
jgi:hypothetical protein